MTDATEDLARLSYRIEELESLLVMERQTTIGQAAEIQRIRALAKAAETRFSVDRASLRSELLNELARFFAEFSDVALKEGPSVAGVYADVSAFCKAAADRGGWIG